MRREPKIRLATIALIIFILMVAAYAVIIAEDSCRRAEEMISQVDILTDGMGR